MKKILVIGAGSIGKRHIRVLHEIGEKNIAVLRSGKGGDLPADLVKICTVFYSEKDAFLWCPTHLLICNPTSLHEKFIEASVKRGIPYFVEKPISDNYNTLVKLKSELDSENFYKGMVGYVLRFNELFMFIRKIISEKVYGNVITASIKVGQYLPNWHPDEDYRKAYFARKDLGGGVIITLSHEIDLVQFLFGKINRVFAKVSKLSNLDIDVDDVTDLLVSTELCKQIHLNLNYLEPSILRAGEIYFEKGKLEYSYTTGSIEFTFNSGKKEIIFETKADYNLQFKRQMIAFLDKLDVNISCDIMQGIDVLEVIQISEESSKTGKELCIN